MSAKEFKNGTSTAAYFGTTQQTEDSPSKQENRSNKLPKVVEVGTSTEETKFNVERSDEESLTIPSDDSCYETTVLQVKLPVKKRSMVNSPSRVHDQFKIDKRFNLLDDFRAMQPKVASERKLRHPCNLNLKP